MKMLWSYVPLYTVSVGREEVSDFDFAIKGPLPWKSLPMDSRQAPSVMTFKKRLKTYLFREDIPIQKIILFQRLKTQTLNWLVTNSKRRYWNKLNNNNNNSNNKNTLTHDRRKMSTFGQCVLLLVGRQERWNNAMHLVCTSSYAHMF